MGCNYRKNLSNEFRYELSCCLLTDGVKIQSKVQRYSAVVIPTKIESKSINEKYIVC